MQRVAIRMIFWRAISVVFCVFVSVLLMPDTARAQYGNYPSTYPWYEPPPDPNAGRILGEGQVPDGMTVREVPAVFCWWKTDRSAIRVAEHFRVILTCAFVQTPLARTVIDEAQLDSSAVSLVPFEIVQGQRSPDVVREPYRYIQYVYTVRLIAKEGFGKEIPLPELQFPYHTEYADQGKSLVIGKDLAYKLPAFPIRVHSLVPKGAKDIRDYSTEVLKDAQKRQMRAYFALVFAAAMLIVPVLWFIVGFVRGRKVRKTASGILLSLRRISGYAYRELRDVKKLQKKNGWSEVLIRRALTAFRIIASAAVAPEKIYQREADRQLPVANMHGCLIVRRWVFIGGIPRRRSVVLSSELTAETVVSFGGGKNKNLASVAAAVAYFTRVRYGREEISSDLGLAAAFTSGVVGARKLHRSFAWYRRAMRHMFGLLRRTQK